MDRSRPTPLQQELDAFTAEGACWLPADLFQALLSPIGQLVRAGAAKHALQEGMLVPDFTLPDAGGQVVQLAPLLRQGPIILLFYRGAWCPYCHLTLRAYERAVPAFQAAGATLLALSPQTPEHSRTLAHKLGLSFALLSDAGNQVARQWGLVFTLEEAVRAAHLQVGADLPRFNGDASWDLPMTGTFLVDQSGMIRLAFVEPDFTRRLDPASLIDRLHELQR